MKSLLCEQMAKKKIFLHRLMFNCEKPSSSTNSSYVTLPQHLLITPASNDCEYIKIIHVNCSVRNQCESNLCSKEHHLSRS